MGALRVYVLLAVLCVAGLLAGCRGESARPVESPSGEAEASSTSVATPTTGGPGLSTDTTGGESSQAVETGDQEMEEPTDTIRGRPADAPAWNAVLLARSTVPRDAPATAAGGGVEIDSQTGCVTLSGHPIVWPLGTTASLAPPVVQLETGVVLRPGDRVTGAGGHYSTDQLGELDEIVVNNDYTDVITCGTDTSTTVVFFVGADGLRVERAQ